MSGKDLCWSPSPLSCSAAWARSPERWSAESSSVSSRASVVSCLLSHWASSASSSSLFLCCLFVQRVCSECGHEIDNRSLRGPCVHTAVRRFERHAQLSGCCTRRRAGRSGMEHSWRIWRAVFLWPCSFLWLRRVRNRCPAGQIRFERLVCHCGGHRGRRAGWRHHRFPRISLGIEGFLFCPGHPGVCGGAQDCCERDTDNRCWRRHTDQT